MNEKEILKLIDNRIKEWEELRDSGTNDNVILFSSGCANSLKLLKEEIKEK